MTEAKEQTKHELIGKLVLISLCMCSKAEIWEQAGLIVVWDLKSSLMSLPSHLWSTGDGVMLTKTFHSWSLSWEPFVDLAILHPSRNLWVQGGHYWPHPEATWAPWRSLPSTGFLPAQHWLFKAWTALKPSASPNLAQNLWKVHSHPVLWKASGPSNWDSPENGGVGRKVEHEAQYRLILKKKFSTLQNCN